MGIIKHILYTSVATAKLSEQQLEQLLSQARAKNIQHQVTGILLYRGGSFMQVLEGPSENVDAIYASIIKDSRHKNVVTLCDSPIAERDFAQWAMAFNGKEDEHVEGLSDFLHPFRSADECNIPEGAVKQLLKTFRHINKR
jgi:hypothetical protein